MSSRASRSTKRKAEQDAPLPAAAAVTNEAAAAPKLLPTKKQKKNIEKPAARQQTKAEAKEDSTTADTANKGRGSKQAVKPTNKAATDAAVADKPTKKKAKALAVAEASKDSPKVKKVGRRAAEAAAAGAASEQALGKKQTKEKKGKQTKQKSVAAAEEQPKKVKRNSKKQKKKKKKKQKEEEEEEQVEEETPHDIFMGMIAEKEKELNKHCIILEQFDGDEDEVTIEELQQLKKVFVPEQTWEEFVEVWSELDSVGEDSEDEAQGEEDAAMAAFMKAFMGKFLNTKHGAEMHTILNKHLKAVDKSLKAKAWQDAFCLWAAVVMAARREGHWWEDTDVPDAAVAIYTKLREQWAKLKACSDEELGGLVCEGELSAKDELSAWLQGMAEEMRQMDYNVPDVA